MKEVYYYNNGDFADDNDAVGRSSFVDMRREAIEIENNAGVGVTNFWIGDVKQTLTFLIENGI
jgi:hypothetical protein